MTLLDRILLLATGLTALYLIYRMRGRYLETRGRHWLYAMLAFTMLFVAGVLLILFTYDALASPLVVIVAVLIPAGIASALMTRSCPRCETGFLVFAVAGLLAIAVTRFSGPAGLATVILIIVHSVAGLTIVALPAAAVIRRQESAGYIWVTIGGVLIGLGGVALAFLKTGRQLLFFTADFVFAILAPLLLLMTLAFTAGFVSTIKHARA